MSLAFKAGYKKRADVKFTLKFFDNLPNPYQTAAAYYRAMDMNPYVYGETPLYTVDKIFKKLSLPSKTKVLDLGAGDFKLSFFLNKAFGLQVYGVEKVPIFCQNAKVLKHQLSIDDVHVIEGDYQEIDLPSVDLAFLFGSNLEDEEIIQLLKKVEGIARVVTVSYSLSDYSEDYETIEEMNLPFLFGFTKVFINQRRSICSP